MTDVDLFEILNERVTREVAEALGVSPSTVRVWRARGAIPERYHATIRSWAAGEDVTPPVPLDAIPAGHRVKGVSTLVDAEGNVSSQWVKTYAGPVSPEETIQRLISELPRTIPAREGYIPCPTSPGQDDLLVVYPMGDPHVGMLAWKDESGASFDLAIAERLMVGAMVDLVVRGPRARRGLIVNLGDFFHFDNVHHHTTVGAHSLDVDGRTMRVLQTGMRIQTAMIDAALSHHEHVTYDSRIGNHDSFASLMLALGIQSYYRNEPRVKVVIEPAHRAYHRFGKVLIGTTHGDRSKGERLAQDMAAERAEDWGATTHRYWLTGHVHHTSVKEFPGVVIESFRTLAGRDSWHAAQGYVTGRDMHRLTFHRTHGLISREIASVDYLQARGAA